MRPVEYGPVIIIGGRYKGQIGLYDDDEGGRPIVYLFRKLGYVTLKSESYLEQLPLDLDWCFANTMLYSVSGGDMSKVTAALSGRKEPHGEGE